MHRDSKSDMVMAGGSIHERLVQLLKGCLTEVITDLGATIATGIRVDALDGREITSGQGRIAVVIDFGNDHIRGALTLIGERRVFLHLLPRVPKIPTESHDIVDWAQELANLAVGRFKNRAHARGLDVALDCPRSLSLAQADQAAKDRAQTPWDIDVDGMQLETRFTVEILGSVILRGADEFPRSEPVTEGGEVLIF